MYHFAKTLYKIYSFGKSVMSKFIDSCNNDDDDDVDDVVRAALTPVRTHTI